MKNNFIRLYDTNYPGTSYWVNINNIVLVRAETTMVLMSGAGNENSVLTITQESHARLLKAIEKNAGTFDDKLPEDLFTDMTKQ